MTNNENYSGILPHNAESYWTSSIQLPEYPSLENDMQVDVIIVGGGITGITSAYLLINEGLKIAVIEADKLLNGTTGHTTAKITAQHDIIYHFSQEDSFLKEREVSRWEMNWLRTRDGRKP
ncbi:FAD-dependent oxidoreductase, partial [Bacillus sp. JUb91]|uniref:FAD-dependent oxidoreductase n=2 Tax=Bacillaceae TaxID=186817 RepID=UPI002167E88E